MRGWGLALGFTVLVCQAQASEAAQGNKASSLVSGTGPVCAAVRDALTPRWADFLEPPRKTPGLSALTWEPTEAPLGELNGAEEAVVDFDNDGKRDRVFMRSFEDRYMNGSVLLVQSGHSASVLQVGATPLEDNAWFIPCQLDARTLAVKECPPFSQNNDEAGLRVQGRTAKEQVFFRARYSAVTPFRFDNITYVLVTGQIETAAGTFGAVLKPLPDHQFATACVFQRTPTSK